MPLKEGAINEILPFAPEGLVEAGDLLGLLEYATHPLRRRGHAAGMALREVENRANRQATHMAAGLAQFIANRYPPGVTDDANLDKVEEGLVHAITSLLTIYISEHPGSGGTGDGELSAPTVISPALDETGVPLTPTIVIQEAVVSGQDIVNKQIQISTKSDFSSSVWDSNSVAYAPASLVGVSLAKATRYYVRARLYGSKTGWTGWGAIVPFTTTAVAPGDEWSYYSPGSYEFIVPETGDYQLTAAGAGGGTYAQVMNWCFPSGGYGGRSAGKQRLTRGDKITVSVGSGGGGHWNYGCDCGWAGGSSSVGGYVTGTGGQPGCACGGCTDGAPGVGVGGNLENVTGGGSAGGTSNVQNGGSGNPGWCRIKYVSAA